MGESRPRSILKSLSWRLIATGTTMLLVLLFTGSVEIAVSVGGLEILAKLVIYYLHERAWQRLSWGMVPVPQRSD